MLPNWEQWEVDIRDATSTSSSDPTDLRFFVFVASDRTVIDLLNDVNVETLNANKAMTITLSGGHNAGYTAQAGSTELWGR
jgi:hypothetical protein